MLKKTTLKIGLFTLVLFTITYLACLAHGKSTVDCERIADHDKRYMCKAMVSGQRVLCEYIRDRDMRVICKAGIK